ncbi:MAG TPA: hypothetical protein VFR02_02305, partial [bacterium]|nr:hypothetical protein [bacterium]
TINFDDRPPSMHEALTYSTSHPYGACCCGLWVRAWDDPRLPFEFQNDRYVRRWLALGYFFHPGEVAYLYPAYAR